VRVVQLLWLAALWVVLWGEVTVANVVGGLAVAVVVLWAVPLRARRGALTVRPLAALRLLSFFVVQLVVSTGVVVVAIMSPSRRVRTGIVAIPVRGCSDGVVTLVANFITLTPGTLTLEVRRDPMTLYVHVLHVEDVESVRRDVLHLERLAVRAFGSREALAQLEPAP